MNVELSLNFTETTGIDVDLQEGHSVRLLVGDDHVMAVNIQ